ncbi:MAG: A/G-specific adenine glycosylase [Planctomycetota bacterium]
MTAESFAARLLAHYDRTRRPLPWRRPGVDAWTTWVCEVMSQQTRIEVVERRLPEFLERFPNPESFAGASDEDLHDAWQGLGYYRRARLLRQGATEVNEQFDGRIPADHAALRGLSGIGDYTAAAIASIAFGLPQAAVDGNVERILARHGGVRDEVRKAAGRRQIRELAERHLDPNRPGDFNQALMDLGSSICTPRNPNCAACPIQRDCEAHRLELIDALPVLPARRESIDVAACALLIEAEDGFVAARIPDGEVNAGQFELPGPGVLVDQPDDQDLLRARIFERYGLEVRVGEELARVRHGITHHRITLRVHQAERLGPLPEGLSSMAPGDGAGTWSTPMRKIFKKLGVDH